MPLPLGEVAERSEAGEGILPLPLGEVAEQSEDGEGEDGARVSQAKLLFKENDMKKKFIRLLSTVLTGAFLLAGCGEAASVTEGTVSESVSESTAAENTGNSEGGEVVVSVNYNSDITVSESDNNKVFYEIFVGSFSDSDGDGIGDLQGIINRMDYLNDGDDSSGGSLGIEGIWLSPIFSSSSYHKYDVNDYYTIDEDFGDMDDLKELVSLAHERGVEVILDMVINHTGSGNEKFTEFAEAHRNGDTSSPMYDYYSWSDTAKSGYSKISGTEQYYECNFSTSMPELNYDNETVYEDMLEVMRYYLEDIGVDGFRFDAAKYIYYSEVDRNVEFWSKLMEDLKAIKPDIYTVAEVWDSDSVTNEYEKAINCFDFTMSQVSGRIATAAKKGDVNAYTKYVESYIDTVKGINENAMIIPFIANHDMDRAAGYMMQLGGYAKVAANLYILGPGSPFIYYGEEVGMKGSRGSANTDANRRLAMTWGDGDTVSDPEGADYEAEYRTNDPVSEQLSNENSLYNYYKKLIMIRKANPEIASGEYEALSFSDTKVGGFISTLEGSSVMVIHNTTTKEQTVDLSAVTDLSFTNVIEAVGYYDGTYDNKGEISGTMLTISPQTSVVIR